MTARKRACSDQIAHKSIVSLSTDIENFRFNRAVAQLHILANAIAMVKSADKVLQQPNVLAWRPWPNLSPLSPHIAEEIWQSLGHETMLATIAWPDADESLAADNEIEVAIQVNGKLRDTIMLSRDCEMLMPKHVHWSQSYSPLS